MRISPRALNVTYAPERHRSKEGNLLGHSTGVVTVYEYLVGLGARRDHEAGAVDWREGATDWSQGAISAQICARRGVTKPHRLVPARRCDARAVVRGRAARGVIGVPFERRL